jgi:peptidyl-prolyl cis-trans isomerase C
MLVRELVAIAGILAFASSALAQTPAAEQAPAAGQTPAAGPAPAAGEDPVVAIVDGSPIHRTEVEAAKRNLPEQFRQMPLEVIYSVLLDRVIDFRLLANEAERQDVASDPGVEAALEQARRDVLRDAFVRQKIDEGTTDAKLHERYEQLKQSADFKKEEVHASHILLKSEDEAKAVIQELAAGADFATVAKQKSVGPSASNGGDLGYFTREQMVPEFAAAAFALEVGQVSSEPVQTQFGWHVIKVLDRRTTEPTFAESEPRLRQDLAREIVTALVTDLRGGAAIERFNLDGTPMQQPPPAAQ